MKVIEFGANRAFTAVIHDGPVEIRGRTTFDPVYGGTRLTIVVEIPGMDESMDTSFLTGRLERSAQNIKELIEAEVWGWQPCNRGMHRHDTGQRVSEWCNEELYAGCWMHLRSFLRGDTRPKRPSGRRDDPEAEEGSGSRGDCHLA